MDAILQKYRRDLHQIPELDHTLPKTIAYILRQLHKLRCVVFHPTPSSIAAYFDFNQSDTFAFRSDMDALPIDEKGNTSYTSVHPGCMHACGHDAHMAMLLGFANRLNTYKSAKHNVLLIFQPAEETTGGAKEIIDTDILETYHVRAMFGFHVWPDIPKGVVASKAGPLMARSNEVSITIHGKSSHAARYQEGKDALQAGVSFLHKAYEMEAHMSSSILRLLKFGKIESGTVRNVISNYTKILGTLRTYDNEVANTMQEALYTIAKQVEIESGCTLQVAFSKGYPPLINDTFLFDQCLIQLPSLHTLKEPSLLAEDFSFYGEKVASVFFYIGSGYTIPLHSATFDLDESILSTGVKTYEMLLTLDLT